MVGFHYQNLPTSIYPLLLKNAHMHQRPWFRSEALCSFPGDSKARFLDQSLKSTVLELDGGMNTQAEIKLDSPGETRAL